jgi:hypothetical protein
MTGDSQARGLEELKYSTELMELDYARGAWLRRSFRLKYLFPISGAKV